MKRVQEEQLLAAGVGMGEGVEIERLDPNPANAIRKDTIVRVRENSLGGPRTEHHVYLRGATEHNLAARQLVQIAFHNGVQRSGERSQREPGRPVGSGGRVELEVP